MKPEAKALWVAALRSGKYEQGRYALKTVDPARTAPAKATYCCLGVLCEVARETGVKVRYHETSAGFGKYDDNATSLPPSVSDWAGIDTWDGNVVLRDEKGEEVGAISLNDRHGKTFAEIADLVEEQL